MTLETTQEPAADGPLFHDERGEVRLSDFWQKGTTVFVHLRHFG